MDSKWLLLHIKSHGSCVLQYHVINSSYYISTTTVPMVNKYCRVVKNKKLWSIVSFDPSIMCSCEVMWHNKYVISLLALDPWTPNLARWRIIVTTSGHLIAWKIDLLATKRRRHKGGATEHKRPSRYWLLAFIIIIYNVNTISESIFYTKI